MHRYGAGGLVEGHVWHAVPPGNAAADHLLQEDCGHQQSLSELEQDDGLRILRVLGRVGHVAVGCLATGYLELPHVVKYTAALAQKNEADFSDLDGFLICVFVLSSGMTSACFGNDEVMGSL